MLIEMKHRIDEPEVTELLEYVAYQDGFSLEQTVEVYKSDASQQLLALIEEEELIGLVGIRAIERDVEIRHLVVKPEFRGLGYGRGILLELIEAKSPKTLFVETDDESVDFYRSVGFSVSSLGETQAIEKFRCVFHIDSEMQE